MGGLLQTLKSLGPTRLMAISGVGVLLLVFFAFLIMRVSAPNMELLYRDLDPGDASQIVNRLEDQQKNTKKYGITPNFVSKNAI